MQVFDRLPVPLDHGCNPVLSPIDKGHPGSCELTRIALAVWRVNPDFYAEFHGMLLSDPPPDPVAVMVIPRENVTVIALKSDMREPWIDELIRVKIAYWVSFSSRKNTFRSF